IRTISECILRLARKMKLFAGRLRQFNSYDKAVGGFSTIHRIFAQKAAKKTFPRASYSAKSAIRVG
ncbi:hypothetical protein, partial [Erythrobacter sp.]|uniref:hypothetical protein n=1 Tax=Erythrobacter sp. TaxID=1042 RepID=UPI00311E2B0D